jgi:hypothetical protein
MAPIQESSGSFTPVKPRSSDYYAAGALAHLGLAGALTAFGSRWGGVPLLAAGMLAVLAARARHTPAPRAASRQPRPPLPVIHAVRRDSSG